VSSRSLIGKSTRVSSLSVKGPLIENRLRTMIKTAGSRDRDSCLEAFRKVLQTGQCLQRELSNLRYF
jgi:hypothetical protein